MCTSVQVCFVLLFSLFIIAAVTEKKGKQKKTEKEPEEEKWKKKDITDYNEGDLERLYEQWEEDDEPLEEDEQPEWKRKPQPIDMSKLNLDDPESVLRMTKKGKSLMMFATVAGDPTEKETESITALWQSSMFNAHLELQRYIVGPNRVLFMVPDGAKAWDVKNFLIQQDKCAEVTIDGQSYPGKGAKTADKDNKNNEKKKTGDKKKSEDKKDKNTTIKKDKKSEKDKEKKKKGKEDDNNTQRRTEL